MNDTTRGRGKMYAKDKGKTFRALTAIANTNYDVQTKMVLVLYARELRWYRLDWESWPGVRALAKGASLTKDTVIDRRRILIRDKILIRVEGEHPQSRKRFTGRPTHRYRLNVRRLEALVRLTARKATLATREKSA